MKSKTIKIVHTVFLSLLLFIGLLPINPKLVLAENGWQMQVRLESAKFDRAQEEKRNKEATEWIVFAISMGASLCMFYLAYKYNKKPK